MRAVGLGAAQPHEAVAEGEILAADDVGLAALVAERSLPGREPGIEPAPVGARAELGSPRLRQSTPPRGGGAANWPTRPQAAAGGQPKTRRGSRGSRVFATSRGGRRA